MEYTFNFVIPKEKEEILNEKAKDIYLLLNKTVEPHPVHTDTLSVSIRAVRMINNYFFLAIQASEIVLSIDNEVQFELKLLPKHTHLAINNDHQSTKDICLLLSEYV